MKIAIIIIAVIIVFLGLLYFLDLNNGEEYVTQVDLISQKYMTKTGWVILVSASAGVILMLPVIILIDLNYRRKIRKLNKENRSLNQNIANIQNIPIEEANDDIFQE